MKLSKTIVSTSIVALSVTFTSIVGCKHEPIQEPVCFESEVLPIFQSNCTMSGCHNSIDHEEGYDFTTFDGIREGIQPGKPNDSDIWEAINEDDDDIMPPSPYAALTADQKEIIRLWIEQGALNTTDCSSDDCDTLNVTYSGTIAPLLSMHCTGCHSGGAPSGSIALTNYLQVKSRVDDGSLLGSVRWDDGFSTMPDGGQQLAPCKIRAIELWIEDGAPNN